MALGVYSRSMRNTQMPHRAQPEKLRYDIRKASIWLGASTAREMKLESDRLDKSISWVVQRAWMHAKNKIAEPHASDPPDIRVRRKWMPRVPRGARVKNK